LAAKKYVLANVINQMTMRITRPMVRSLPSQNPGVPMEKARASGNFE